MHDSFAALLQRALCSSIAEFLSCTYIFIKNFLLVKKLLYLLSFPLHMNQFNNKRAASVGLYILPYLWTSRSCSTSWSLSLLAWSSLRWYSACCSERRPFRSSHSCRASVSLWAADSSNHFILVLRSRKTCLNIRHRLVVCGVEHMWVCMCNLLTCMCFP